MVWKIIKMTFQILLLVTLFILSVMTFEDGNPVWGSILLILGVLCVLGLVGGKKKVVSSDDK